MIVPGFLYRYFIHDIFKEQVISAFNINPYQAKQRPGKDYIHLLKSEYKLRTQEI